MLNGNNMINECVIYDFETLSQNQINGVVLSFAMISYSESRFNSSPYSYQELVNSAKMIKFDVAEQVKKFERKIDKSTLEWWQNQPKKAQAQSLKPMSTDKSITELYSFFVENANVEEIKKVYTRGNTFDPIFFEHIMKQIGKEDPYPWWVIRDTRSLLDGLLWGTDANNKFIPPGLEKSFIAHDPCHDIAMDIMRMQTIIQALNS
jgi:hypothetical protein